MGVSPLRTSAVVTPAKPMPWLTSIAAMTLAYLETRPPQKSPAPHDSAEARPKMEPSPISAPPPARVGCARPVPPALPAAGAGKAQQRVAAALGALRPMAALRAAGAGPDARCR